MRLTLTRPDDWHLHLRDGEMLKSVLPDTARRFARAIAMPNLVPPVVNAAQARGYYERIRAATPAGADFEPLIVLYLTEGTTPDDIAEAKASGIVHAVKWYPAGATTNSHAGVQDIARCDAVLAAMERHDLPLLVHGEVTDPSVDIFDREKAFIDRFLIGIVERFPGLRVVFEHITTRDAAQFVEAAPARVGATITAHHLLLNRNALFVGGVRPHHYCLPVLKREVHRQALVAAAPVAAPSSSSAPIARRMRATPKKRPAAVRASTPRTRPSSYMPRRSSKPARSTGSKRSPASTARTFTGCRATPARSRSKSSRGRCRPRSRLPDTSWCRSAPARRSPGAWSDHPPPLNPSGGAGHDPAPTRTARRRPAGACYAAPTPISVLAVQAGAALAG